VPFLVYRDFIAKSRSRPDYAHVSLENVPELRQLIEAPPAQETAGAGDAIVVDKLVTSAPSSLQHASVPFSMRLRTYS